MSLHLELSGDMTATELAAVAALIDVLRGEKPHAAAPVKVPEAKPAEAKAEIPKPPENAAAVIPPPPGSSIAPDAAPSGEAAPLVDTTQEFTPPEGKAPVGELDATGLPWDARIHASTKTQKADKTWTAKRNVATDLVTQVTAELRQNMAAAGTPAPNDDAPVFTDPAQAFGGGGIAAAPPPTEGTVVPPPPATTVPPPPAEETAPAAADGGMAEFARIMRVVVEKQKAGALSTEMASGIARQLGLSDMRGLATRLDLIPAFEALLP